MSLEPSVLSGDASLARSVLVYLASSECAELRAGGDRPALGIVSGPASWAELQTLGQLIEHVDCVFVGGDLAAVLDPDRPVGSCAFDVDPKLRRRAQQLRARMAWLGREMMFPVDLIVAARLEAGAAHHVVSVEACPPRAIVTDCGPASINQLFSRIRAAKAVVWTGLLGAFDLPPFCAGTAATARLVARLTCEGRLMSGAYGKCTAQAIHSLKLERDFTNVSSLDLPIVKEKAANRRDQNAAIPDQLRDNALAVADPI